MKLTNKIYDKDRIEIPVYVNGSFAEKLVLTGKELLRFIALLEEPVEFPNGSVVVPAETIKIQVDGTDGKNLDVGVITLDKLPKGTTVNNTAGDSAKELRKDPEMQAGDAASEKRGD